MSVTLILALTLAVPGTAVAPEVSLPASLDLEPIRALVVQHDGRCMPLDTLARDTVESITGKMFYQGHDPVLLLLAWSFDGPTWEHQPLIRIGSAELRAKLELSETQTVFSGHELVNHRPLHSLIAKLRRIPQGRKLDALENKVADISHTLDKLYGVFAGKTIRAIPDPKQEDGAWQPITTAAHAEAEGGSAVWSAWTDVGQAFGSDDAPAFTEASRRLVTALAALPAAHSPDPRTIATELQYNRIQPFRTAWMVMVVGAVLATSAMLVRRKWFDALAVVGMLAGFAVLTYGLWLRWQIAGRIPAANMFESLLFLSWGMGAFAILSMLLMHDRSIPLTASAMGALALVLAECLLPHQIRPIVAVLRDTVWMSIHVPIIMVSYSILALAVLIAHVQLAVMAFAPGKRNWIAAIDARHYWYIHVGSILLLAGIITGSMWGASSWGRYWGWDPKEVWSLVAFVGYLTILHVRVDRRRVAWWAYLVGALMMVGLFVLILPPLAPLTGSAILIFAGAAIAIVFFVTARGRLATAIKSVACFWLILMTYLGVNYVLGAGLHTYGFGTGAVARRMQLAGGIDLGFVLILSAIHLLRRAPGAPLSQPAPVTALP